MTFFKNKFSLNISKVLLRLVFVNLIQLVSMILIARLYQPEGNGIYAIAILLPTTLSTFLNCGIASSNAYFLGSNKNNLSPILNFNLISLLFLSITGMAIGVLIIIFYAHTLFPNIPETLLWTALFSFPLILHQGYIISIFQGLQKFNTLIFISVIQPITFLAIIAILFVNNITELDILVAGYVFSFLLSAIYSSFCIFQEKKPVFKNKGDYSFKKSFFYGLKSHLSNILAFLNYRLDLFLMNYFLDPIATGLYVIAIQIAERMWIIPNAISTVLLPKISSLNNREKIRSKITPMIIRNTLAIMLLTSAIISVIAYYFIPLLFGKSYEKSYLVLLCLLPGIIAGSASKIIANDIAARGRPELNLYASIIVVAINLLGNIILIPQYGLIGGAFATTIAYLVNLGLRIAIYKSFVPIKLSRLLLVNFSEINSYIRRKN